VVATETDGARRMCSTLARHFCDEKRIVEASKRTNPSALDPGWFRELIHALSNPQRNVVEEVYQV
jgi:hypothetical protein